ncbi:hypothetical protein HMPREF9080_02561 [Cardiobacterium valvarum F0432]|uniref:Uncharacterized protein n=1 Tax=Cardiobacterium valvarum F0432 TaxID=797473 RepID=G9ZIF0_9GAMM|nr:hypothetical protein HMPREF9080_02561 [Cardiobacterium valvarum F0432]
MPRVFPLTLLPINPVFFPLGGIWRKRIDDMESLQAISLQDRLPIVVSPILFPPGMA